MVSWDRERTETLESKEAGQYSKSLDLQTMMPTKLPHELHSTDCNIAVPGTYNNRLKKLGCTAFLREDFCFSHVALIGKLLPG